MMRNKQIWKTATSYTVKIRFTVVSFNVKLISKCQKFKRKPNIIVKLTLKTLFDIGTFCFWTPVLIEQRLFVQFQVAYSRLFFHQWKTHRKYLIINNVIVYLKLMHWLHFKNCGRLNMGWIDIGINKDSRYMHLVGYSIYFGK